VPRFRVCCFPGSSASAFAIPAGRGDSSWLASAPGFADLRISGRAAQLASNLARAVTTAVWQGYLIGALLYAPLKLSLAVAFGVALGFRIPLGIAVAPIEWAEHPAATMCASTPAGNLRSDRNLCLIKTLSYVIAFGFWGGYIVVKGTAPTIGLPAALVIALLVGPAAGLLVGLASALAIGHHRAWLVYRTTTYRLARWGRLPPRLMSFLDDAHRLGLLRQVGAVYQFRHAEFADHLASGYASGLRAQSPPREVPSAVAP
jgi:hypothetical protein